MSETPSSSQIGTLESGSPQVGGVRARLVTTLMSHSVVDFFSFVPVALLPLLVTQLDLTTREKALLLGLGSMTSGVVQPMVAWVSDRFDTRVLSTLGFGLAVVCVANLGRAETFWQLMVLHGFGAAGIGAFHPPAAAATGQMSGRKRSLGMGIFFVMGMIGGITGNITTPKIVAWLSTRAPEGVNPEKFGMLSLSWLMIPGLIAVVALGIAIAKAPHRRHGAHEHHENLDPRERRRRWEAAGILYVGNVIRFAVNVALIYLLSEWAEQLVRDRHGIEQLTDATGIEASAINGPLQGAMQIGMGFFGLLLGATLAARHEKLAFVGLPVFGAIVMALFPWAVEAGSEHAVPVAFGVTILAGVGFGSLIPVSMTAAQRLLPHRTSLASGMMLGGAWAFAGVGPIWAEAAQKAWGLDAGFYLTGAILFFAGVLALFIPSALLIETDHHEKNGS